MGFTMAGSTTGYRAYRYRIYPTQAQGLALVAQLGFACDLYNAALEQRRYAWRAGRRIGYVTQCRELTELRAAGDGPPKMSCSAMRNPLRRRHLAATRSGLNLGGFSESGAPR